MAFMPLVVSVTSATRKLEEPQAVQLAKMSQDKLCTLKWMLVENLNQFFLSTRLLELPEDPVTSYSRHREMAQLTART